MKAQMAMATPSTAYAHQKRSVSGAFPGEIRRQSRGGNSGAGNSVRHSEPGTPSTAMQPFTWTITNQQPQIVGLTDQSSALGQVVSLAIPDTDPDGNAIVVTAVGLPAGLKVVANKVTGRNVHGCVLGQGCLRHDGCSANEDLLDSDAVKARQRLAA